MNVLHFALITAMNGLIAHAPVAISATEDSSRDERPIALVLKERDEVASRLLQLKEGVIDVEEVRRQAQYAVEALRRQVLAEQIVNTFASRVDGLKKAASSPQIKALQAVCDAAESLGASFGNLRVVETEQRGRMRFSPNLTNSVPALAQLASQGGESARVRTTALRRRVDVDSELGRISSFCIENIIAETPSLTQRRDLAIELLEIVVPFDNKEISARFRRAADATLQPWQEAVNALNEYYARLVAERDEALSRIKALDREVANADSRLRAQENVDGKLVYATYGMILALFVLGVMLIRSDQTLTSVLIENRTIVELVSIGFMLMTIIILGAGKRLSGDTLGALLGTIGGYVFGREVTRRRDERGVELVTPKAIPLAGKMSE